MGHEGFSGESDDVCPVNPNPDVVCWREETAEVIDGFKRVAAAAQVPGLATLQCRWLVADERQVKAAMYTLNQVGKHLVELEEAWLVQALVSEDDLTQTEVAELLNRHKSWVCRRLALLEKLGEEARQVLGLAPMKEGPSRIFPGRS